MPTTSPSDVTLHYTDTGGDGRPVVLIHGWPLSGEAWSENVPALEQAGYRVITYDRRGFGRSDKPASGYDYDHLADDLHGLLTELDLNNVTLVGFSMGGGEVARYISRHGEERLHSTVFAGAVTPYMMKTEDNPEGPLTAEAGKQFVESLTKDRDAFFEDFTTKFFSAGDELKVTDQQRKDAVVLCKQSDEKAALACVDSFGGTDFRNDLPAISVPTLVIHGDTDGIVPFDGSGKRTHDAIADSKLVVIKDGPHGINVSHADEFNQALIQFLSN